MGRENCKTADWVGSECYCAYRDYMYAKCSEMSRCPEGLDDDYDDLREGDDDVERRHRNGKNS